MKEVKEFLVLNGFQKIEEHLYANDMCRVEFFEHGYGVANNAGDAMYSKDHNIYWLIGVLTYYGYMNKNYIKSK